MKHPILTIPKISLLAGLFLCFLLPERSAAQQGKPYLDSLLRTATANYPLIKAKKLQTQALKYAVKYKQNGLIPSLKKVKYILANGHFCSIIRLSNFVNLFTD